MTLYDWPRAAAFGRVIPKNKIYEHAGANTALKDLFVRDVDRIVWSHKLSPETTKLAASKKVPEIQVFRIVVRTATLDRDVLRAIDKAIPFPLIFELVHSGRVKMAAAYKRRSEADSARWVVGDYFEGDWQPEEASRAPLPVALNMGTLYEQLLAPLVAGQTARLVPGMGEAPQAPLSPSMNKFLVFSNSTLWRGSGRSVLAIGAFASASASRFPGQSSRYRSCGPSTMWSLNS